MSELKAYFMHGRDTGGAFRTEETEVKVSPMNWQLQGRSRTASGYGDSTPTQYMAKLKNRWYRVYVDVYGTFNGMYVKTELAESGKLAIEIYE